MTISAKPYDTGTTSGNTGGILAEGSRLDRARAGFRRHFEAHYAQHGRPYEEIEPAYEFGLSVAADHSHRRRSWDEVKNQIRRTWEARNEGGWEALEQAIRHAWDAFRGAA